MNKIALSHRPYEDNYSKSRPKLNTFNEDSDQDLQDIPHRPFYVPYDMSRKTQNRRSVPEMFYDPHTKKFTRGLKLFPTITKK